MIAPEERAEWRLDAEDGARAFGKGSRSHRVLALLDALHAAEARAEAAEAKRDEVRGLAEALDRANAVLIEARDHAQAEVARLRALLAEDVALLEELDAAWGGAGGAGS